MHWICKSRQVCASIALISALLVASDLVHANSYADIAKKGVHKVQNPGPNRPTVPIASLPLQRLPAMVGKTNENYGPRTEPAVGSPNQCVNNFDFDYMRIALTWSPGYCATLDSGPPCKRVNPNSFTIHGVWPSRWKEEGPSFCCFDKELKTANIQGLIPKVRDIWMSYTESDPTLSSISSMRYQWSKHGTCARDLDGYRGQKAYFANSVNLFNKLPVMKTLTEAKIVPIANKQYKGKDIVQALASMTAGKRVQIKCKANFKKPKSPMYLTEVHFCMSKGREIIDCPPSANSCMGPIYYTTN